MQELKKKRFTVLNEGFVCENCKKEVLPTKHDHPRNHCPRCLYSKHVDIYPGDRANSCLNLMKPIGVKVGGKHKYTIIHECTRCYKRIPSPAIIKSEIQPDDLNQIIYYSGIPIKE